MKAIILLYGFVTTFGFPAIAYCSTEIDKLVYLKKICKFLLRQYTCAAACVRMEAVSGPV